MRWTSAVLLEGFVSFFILAQEVDRLSWVLDEVREDSKASCSAFCYDVDLAV